MKIYVHKFNNKIDIIYCFEVEYKNNTVYLVVLCTNKEFFSMYLMNVDVYCTEEPDYTFWFDQELLNKLINLDDKIDKQIKLGNSYNQTTNEIKKIETIKLKEVYKIVKTELKKIIEGE